MTSSSVFNAIGNFFQAIFSGMPWVGLWFNKLLIVIGFIAFFAWIWYMTRQKEVTKWD